MRFTTLIARNLFRRGARSALTLVGLSIGIASVVALLGIAWGFEDSFLAIYEAKGIDLIVVRAGVSDRLTSSLDIDLAKTLRKVPGVHEVAYSLMDSVSFEYANLVSVLVNGWEPDSLLFRGIQMQSGRRWSESGRHQAIVGRVLALNLGKKVGDRLDVAGEPYSIVGIYQSDSLFENGGMIIPLKDLQRMMGREGQVTGFVIGAAPGSTRSDIEQLAHRIEDTIPKVAAVPARDYVEEDNQIRLAKAMAWATSVVALILGSVGMLNTMIMAVFERTGEIGVLRALGWKRRRVLALILGEALSLGMAGALLGTILGYLGVRALAQTPTASGFISTDLSPAILPVGWALGLGLSLLGGIYPALRAASLEPTEALRHE